MRLNRICLFAMAAAAMTITGCGKDDNKGGDDPIGPDGPVEPSGEMKTMTPEESKTFLQDAATELLDLFKPADQKDAIELAAYFQDQYGDLDMPEEFDIDDDDDDYWGAPARFIQLVGRAARGDVDALTRASYHYSYNINFDRFAGIYEPSRREEAWVKTGNSSDIIFKFAGKNGENCELKVTKSGSDSEINFEVEDEDWYWDDTYYYEYNIRIPHNVKATLKAGSKELASADVTSSINLDGHTMSVSATATVCNLKAEVAMDGNNSNIAADTKFYVNSQRVAYAYAKINGRNLCDPEREQSLTSGNCSADVLGKVQAYGDLTYSDRLADDLDAYWSYWDGISKSEGERQCQKACDRINDSIVTKLCYNGTATKQASLQFVPYIDEWGWYDEEHWDCRPVAQLLFPDGTTYDVDSYFERFTTVANKFESLIDAYERVWNNAVR